VTFRVRLTRGAREDLERLYGFILERDPADLDLAQRAVEAIEAATKALERFPFACRKAHMGTPFQRELIIPFGAEGYVALFEIEDAHTVTIVAVRHQREDDYY